MPLLVPSPEVTQSRLRQKPRQKKLKKKVFKSGLLLTALALLTFGCGSDTAASTSTVSSRIVSISPTATEVLFAIGAGPQVVAADEFSTYPPQAPMVPGLSGWAPNVESIANYNPDLVVMSDNSVVEELRALGLDVLVQPAVTNMEGVYAQIIEMGEHTGNEQGAEELVASMRSQITDLVSASASAASESQTFFHELDDTLYSVTSDTFIGYLYSLVGLTNIADGSDPQNPDSRPTVAYPQLSTEYVLAADPDLIFFADGQCCGQTAETISERPGWASLSAVRNGNVIEVNADIASRWGPRSLDFLRAIVDALIEAQG